MQQTQEQFNATLKAAEDALTRATQTAENAWNGFATEIEALAKRLKQDKHGNTNPEGTRYFRHVNPSVLAPGGGWGNIDVIAFYPNGSSEAYLKDGKRERLIFKLGFAEDAVARGNWQEVEPAQSTSFVVGSAALARMQQKIARQKQQINSSLSYTESLEARNKVLRSENERLKTLDAYQQTQPAYKATNDALFKRCEQLGRELKEMTERKDLLKRTAEVLSRKLLGGAER